MSSIKPQQPRYKRRISNSQIICIVALWILLVVWLLSLTSKINGIIIVNIIMSGVIVAIPIYKELQRRKGD